MKRWVWFCTTALALPMIFAAPAAAYSFLDRAFGSPEFGVSVRARAMGGAGSAMGSGAYSPVDNPAAMARDRGNRFHVDGFLARASENRFVPIFDTFDSFVDENAVGVNDDDYGALQGGVVLDRWGENSVVIAAGVFGRLDPRYNYFNEIRTADNSDIILGNRYIDTEGVIRAATLGAAMPLGERFGVGAAVNYYFGTIKDRNALIQKDSSAGFDTEVTTQERKLDGVSVTLGGTAVVNERLTVAASLETAPTLNDDYTRWVGGEIDETAPTGGDLELPLRAQAGLAYRPRNTFRTTFVFDAIYMPWSELKDHLNSELTLEDTWQFRFGLEHVFYNDVAGRLGFRFAESYAMEEADQAVFTFGFGYVLDQIGIDLAGEVGKRNSRQEPIEERSARRVGLGTDRIEDTLFRVFLGATYNF